MPFIQFQHRRDTAALWTSNNPTLASGEMGIETDTALFKIGNGTTPWVSLPYGGLKGATGGTGPAGPPSPAYIFVGGGAFQNYSVGPAFDCGTAT
uniref:Major tropism determinant N-terminal domain-containing protein n=1 Tax=viral metagenome TaxID=1070528 RepID=A0A6C0F536_9ZZZZ